MEIEIVNIRIVQVHKFLYNLKLKGQSSRHRSRLVRLLDERIKELADEEAELLKENCHLNEDGSFKLIEGTQNLDIKDHAEYFKQLELLRKETFVICSPEYQESFEIVRGILNEYDEEISGEDAEAFEYLCEKFNL